MRKVSKCILFAFSACLFFSSCEKMVVEEENDDALGIAEGKSKLTITTRNNGSGEAFVAQARIYVFNQSGKCVQMLSTDGDDATSTIQLEPGTYTLCAVGGDDLGRFSLPLQSEATKTSVISLLDGKVMDSFFSKQMSITLKEGDELTENVNLERKVACLNKIEVDNVPTNVTAVEVTFSSFYSTIRLDGTFPEAPVTTCKVSLTKQSDETTWRATPAQLVFPSVGEPVVSISFKTADGVENYAYTLQETIEANHYYNLGCTYKLSQARLAVMLTAADWDEERDINFEFGDSEILLPVAGEFYKNYYVISVDEQQHTAVLLSSIIAYNAPDSRTDASLWRAELEAQMAVLEKPESSIGDWRLPTVEEAEIFTRDVNVISFGVANISGIYFCEKDGKLIWAYTQKNEDGSYTFKTSNMTPEFTTDVRLRAAISVAY